MRVKRWDAVEALLPTDPQRPLRLQIPLAQRVDQLGSTLGRNLRIDNRWSARHPHFNIRLSEAPPSTANTAEDMGDTLLRKDEREMAIGLLSPLSNATFADSNGNDPLVATPQRLPASLLARNVLVKRLTATQSLHVSAPQPRHQPVESPARHVISPGSDGPNSDGDQPG